MNTWFKVRRTRYIMPLYVALIVAVVLLSQQAIVVDRLIGVGKNVVGLGLYAAAAQASLIFAYAFGGSLAREKISVRKPVARISACVAALTLGAGVAPAVWGLTFKNSELTVTGLAVIGFVGLNLLVGTVSSLAAGSCASFVYLVIATFAANQSGTLSYWGWPLVGRVETELFYITLGLFLAGLALAPVWLLRRAN